MSASMGAPGTSASGPQSVEGGGEEQRPDRLALWRVLRDELAVLRPADPNVQALAALPEAASEPGQPPGDAPSDAPDPRLGEVRDAVDRLEHPLAALCLSGGGIRSASFGLGVLQGLARFDLLRHFDYLSTVSGGGYIGSWLTGWRRRGVPDATIFQEMNRSMASGREAAEIASIRANSNYLTPRLGIVSPDTWSVVALYVRNLILNWLVFGPLFLGVLFAPKICATLLAMVYGTASVAVLAGWAVAGGALLLFALSASVCGRMTAATDRAWVGDRGFLSWVLVPAVLASVCFTEAAATEAARGLAEHRAWTLVLGAAAGAGLYGVAWWVGTRWAKRKPQIRPVGREAQATPFVMPTHWARLAAKWVAGGALAGCIIALGLAELRAIPGAGTAGTVPSATRTIFVLSKDQPGLVSSEVRTIAVPRQAEAVVGASGNEPGAVPFLVVVGLGWMLLALSGAELAYVGLASYARRGDIDREWLARGNGLIAAFTVSWTVIAGVVLYGPWALHQAAGWLAALGGLSGFATIVLGASGKTGATVARNAYRWLSFDTLVSAAAVVFAILLAALLSLVDDAIVASIPGAAVAGSWGRLATEVAAAVVLAGAAVGVSYFVNINRFSLHGVYRNRLVRAFLGGARVDQRDPDRFTGFDQADNIRVAADRSHLRNAPLFHVINTTLNVLSSKNLAWQERKGASFSITPLTCGNPDVGFRPTRVYGDPHGGISLGTAMAISGAAVSPDQGYHSSPLVGFLLMLFNVRLGWWLGNPRHAAYGEEGPTPGIWPALQELAGATNDRSEWIYLSDGGHFENLGLYEMVRRRCRMIVVADAGCDPHCALEDLGNASRKAFIDMGVSIRFDRLDVTARQVPPANGVYCGIGRIDYPGSDIPGWLLYLKPNYFGTESAGVRSYANLHGTFPHESTGDQWFSESQLEAYRALGAQVVELICCGGLPLAPAVQPSALDLAGLRRSAKAYLQRAGKWG